MRLSKDQVKHVAKLASLPLSSQEEKLYGEQLSKILEYFEQLNQVDTSGIEPTFNVSGQHTVYREDEAMAGLSQEQSLSNAPAKSGGMFKTKRIIE